MTVKEDLILDELREIKASVKATRESVIRLETREEQYEKNIDNLNTDVKMITEEKLPDIKTEIETLKTKSSVWGAIAGFLIATFVTIAVKLGDFFVRN